MIFLMISSTHLNWQTIMTQMKKQSRQIIILFNVVSQFVSLKLKRKLIVMFSSEDFTFTNSQRVSSKRIVKSTKRAQTIRIETVRIKRAKIHERSIELLIFLIFETKHFESKNALFVNKHVFFQSDHFDLDSFINAVNITNSSISNQSFSESLVVDVLDFIHDLVSVFVFVFVSVSTSETEFTSTHQWLTRNIVLIDNHSTAAIILNIFDTSLSSSFIDSVSISSENLLFQITTITLQNFLERARRETRQQIRNVYSYDSIINQIVRSFFSEALSARSSHLLLYLFTTINVQISTSAIREIKQKRSIDKSRDRSRESDVEREIQRLWILSLSFSLSLFDSQQRSISRQ
jgi:hypothetical protein